jgi:rod shape-determining protein MreD
MLLLIRYAVIGTLVILLQWLVLGRLIVLGSTADAVLLYVAWLGLNFGRRTGAIAGFVMGLVMDAIFDTWGMHMMLKTVVGFVLGLLPSEEYEEVVILPRQALLGGFVIAFLHNGLQVVFLALQSGSTSTSLTLSVWFGSAIYTALVGTLAALFAMR